MKKISILILSVILFSSCKNEKTLNQEFYAHWMQKDFYEQVKSKKNIAEINAPLVEFVIQPGDTTYNFITLGKKTKQGPFEFVDPNNIVLKDFFGPNHDAKVMLKSNEIEFINPYTEEKFNFVKLDSSIFEASERETYYSYAIPFIHQTYISGAYKNDSSEVRFSDIGKIQGLGKFQNYSFCYDASCRSSKSNTIFLSDDHFEGNYYDYEFKSDSLIIFEIDATAFLRGKPNERKGVKFALKKIN